jgi:hypothetical protein
MCVIRYFQKSGDSDSGDVFSPYIWGNLGFTRVLEKYLSCGYGRDLELLLVQYYVEGIYDINAPENPRQSNYSKKNKDIAVAFSVTKENFHNVGERERRQFIVDTALQAIDLVEGRLGKRKLDIDFKRLKEDVSRAGEEFIQQMA